MIYFFLFIIIYIISIPFSLIFAIENNINEKEFWIVYVPPFCIIVMIFVIIQFAIKIILKI